MSYYNNYSAPQYYQPQPPITNKIYVTSAEDALNRFASPNTITVYFLQDESTIFEVATDAQGRKNIKVRKLVDVEPQKSKEDTKASDYLTRTEFDAFKVKLEGILNSRNEKVGDKK